MHYKIGTRGSKLALTQTNYVMGKLQSAYPEDTFAIEIITTTGDRNQEQALDAIGSKGVFTLEIEEKLLSGEIAMAVHSMKDMPDTPAEGLCFAKAWRREDPRDVLILKNAKSLKELRQGAVLATGSKRRAFQILQLRPDVKVVGIRGNVDTRIRKMNEDPGLDGIVLAAAGLIRLGRSDEITEYLSTDRVIPAPAQGVLAIEVNADNAELLNKINALADGETETAVQIERGFLKEIGGDCHLPVAAYYDPAGSFYALFGDSDGRRLSRVYLPADEGPGKTEQIIKRAVQKIRTDLAAQE